MSHPSEAPSVSRKFALLLGALLGAGVASAQTPNPAAIQTIRAGGIPDSLRYRYRLLGVFDASTGDPVEGVEVLDIISGTKTTTNKSGMISLFFLPDSGSLIRIRKVGYEVQSMSVRISRADTLPVTVVLEHAAQLAPVVINDSAPSRYRSASLREFEERSRAGIGHFITDTVLRKNDNRAMAQVLAANIPGLTAVPATKNGSQMYISSGRKDCPGRAFTTTCMGGASACFVDVYLDDARLPSPVDFAALRASDYTGVEFYSSASVPVKYNGTSVSGCGVLLLWTRER